MSNQMKKHVKVPDGNASQTISLPEITYKDSEDDQQNNHHNYAHSKDIDFGAWRDKQISLGHKKRGTWDTLLPCRSIKESKVPRSTWHAH